VVRDGLVLLLGLVDGIEVVGAAEATAMLRDRVPGASVLVLTTSATCCRTA
jgi:hypothetical protein